MKKKYCAPVIKAVLFKAEEAVSACIIYVDTVSYYETTTTIQGATEDDDPDDWMLYNGNWVKKPRTREERLYLEPTGPGFKYRVVKAYPVPGRPNHS